MTDSVVAVARQPDPAECEWRIENGWIVYGEKTILESVLRSETAYRLVAEHNELVAVRVALNRVRALAEEAHRNGHGVPADVVLEMLEGA